LISLKPNYFTERRLTSEYSDWHRFHSSEISVWIVGYLVLRIESTCQYFWSKNFLFFKNNKRLPWQC